LREHLARLLLELVLYVYPVPPDLSHIFNLLLVSYHDGPYLNIGKGGKLVSFAAKVRLSGIDTGNNGKGVAIYK
jgi:hypothetical protein